VKKESSTDRGELPFGQLDKISRDREEIRRRRKRCLGSVRERGQRRGLTQRGCQAEK
jgi:hypothetical protein